jgi:DNA mismatch repair protein MutL
MAITALPKATIQLLNSAQVLTTPTSLVKELIDNALDAKATSIDIIISPNTLDKIEVRDNGHGIRPDDLDALGRRGHTSKLRSFDELRLLGGITLGFRGEALASAVQLGEVSITTKTEGEPVATKVKLKAVGGIENQTRTSHPIGTTVSVLNFMAKLPVRKKTFEKEAAKTLGKVNQLLQAYALARPSIRFSLKITKGGKGSWSFAPRPNSGVKEAVSQVIGRDAALQCIEKSFVFPESKLEEDGAEVDEEYATNSVTEDAIDQGKKSERFIIEAFLPSADAEPSKIGSGQFLSIDSRPVSHEKGTMKKIVTVFKKYIKDCLADASDNLRNPFVRLNIKCPVASYDPNVEPAKDDVLFGNESLVLEAVEKLFKTVYGECKVAPAAPAPRVLAKSVDNFELLLARKPATLSNRDRQQSAQAAPLIAPSPGPSSPPHISKSPRTNVEENADEPSTNKQRKWGFTMSTDFTKEAEDFEQQTQRNNHGAGPARDADEEMLPELTNPLNPWVIAKMSAPSTRGSATTSRDVNPISALTPITPKVYRVSEPGSDVIHRSNTRGQQTSRSANIEGVRPKEPTRISVQQPMVSSNRQQLPIYDEPDLFITDNEQPRQTSRRNDFVTARDIAPNSLMSPPSTQLSKVPSRAIGLNKPFVSPLVNAENRAKQDSLRQTKLIQDPRPSCAQDGNDQDMPNNSDLAWAMDFEQRKEDATRRRREEVRAARAAEKESTATSVSRSSPHTNRYNAAIASLEAGQPSSRSSALEVKKAFSTSLPDDDPRGYLLRRQQSLASHTSKPGDLPKMLRAKSMKLPLERIPRDAQLHQLIQPLPTEISTLGQTAAILAKDDIYISRGSLAAGLVTISEETSEVARRLQRVVEAWVKDADDEKLEVEYIGDFSMLNQ